MNRLFKTFFIVLAILVVPFCYADKDKKVVNEEPKNQIEDTSATNQDNSQKSLSWSENVEQIDENTEQKSNSWELTDEEKKESEKLSKWLNNLLIETYKSKYSVILNDISTKIKDKKKEDRIKILSSLIIWIKPRIELINSGKTDLTDNRKQVLLALLTYIIQDTEKRIQAIAKEK